MLQYPSYLNLSIKDWKIKIESLKNKIASCTLCPRNCKVNRLMGEKGYCKTLDNPIISSASPHFGEEKELVGINGSGTIFFSNCNLGCVYCQNWEISHKGEGITVTNEKLAELMLNLQSIGCHNINLVTPTHQIHNIVIAISIASKNGLKIPIVYNCGGHESIETLKILEGIIDIYMPDFKYGDNETAVKYSDCLNYFDVAKEALREMYNQEGDLTIDDAGIMKRGLIVRHLVLPNNLANSENVLNFIAKEISTNILLNIMDQYYPAFKSKYHESLNRRIKPSEYSNVLHLAKNLGFQHLA